MSRFLLIHRSMSCSCARPYVQNVYIYLQHICTYACRCKHVSPYVRTYMYEYMCAHTYTYEYIYMYIYVVYTHTVLRFAEPLTWREPGAPPAIWPRCRSCRLEGASPQSSSWGFLQVPQLLRGPYYCFWCMRSHVYLYTYVFAYRPRVLSIHIYIYTHIYIHIYFYIYIYVCTHIHVYACPCVYIYIYTYVCMCMFRHIHTYIHTYVRTDGWTYIMRPCPFL